MANFSHRTTPFNTLDSRYVPYRVTFQTVHPKSHMGGKYSHSCSVWTRHYTGFTPNNRDYTLRPHGFLGCTAPTWLFGCTAIFDKPYATFVTLWLTLFTVTAYRVSLFYNTLLFAELFPYLIIRRHALLHFAQNLSPPDVKSNTRTHSPLWQPFNISTAVNRWVHHVP